MEFFHKEAFWLHKLVFAPDSIASLTSHPNIPPKVIHVECGVKITALLANSLHAIS